MTRDCQLPLNIQPGSPSPESVQAQPWPTTSAAALEQLSLCVGLPARPPACPPVFLPARPPARPPSNQSE